MVASRAALPILATFANTPTVAQVKQASVDHTPFQTEEAWVDQVAQATSGEAPAELSDVSAAISDPTIANAGLTELEAPRQNGVPAEASAEPSSAAAVSSGDVGNLAGERWDTNAAGTSAGAEQGGLDESYEIVPRPSEEVDVPAAAAPQPQGISWADEPVHEATAGVGNQAGESWNVKAPGEQNDSRGAEPAATDGWAEQSEAAAAADDGFSEVPGRTRGGRGGHRGRGGDGEHRARGRGGFRGNRGGDGEFRGRGRGGSRGNRGDGEGRGGRGRGRGGPRGGAEGGNAARS